MRHPFMWVYIKALRNQDVYEVYVLNNMNGMGSYRLYREELMCATEDFSVPWIEGYLGIR
jgi:hypothetical protein